VIYAISIRKLQDYFKFSYGFIRDESKKKRKRNLDGAEIKRFILFDLLIRPNIAKASMQRRVIDKELRINIEIKIISR